MLKYLSDGTRDVSGGDILLRKQLWHGEIDMKYNGHSQRKLNVVSSKTIHRYAAAASRLIAYLLRANSNLLTRKLEHLFPRKNLKAALSALQVAIDQRKEVQIGPLEPQSLGPLLHNVLLQVLQHESSQTTGPRIHYTILLYTHHLAKNGKTWRDLTLIPGLINSIVYPFRVSIFLEIMRLYKEKGERVPTTLGDLLDLDALETEERELDGQAAETPSSPTSNVNTPESQWLHFLGRNSRTPFGTLRQTFSTLWSQTKGRRIMPELDLFSDGSMGVHFLTHTKDTITPAYQCA
ncbi:hypothetical protein BS47DRAFT_438025 [Hydnum rufescens UP504]|uniref:Uncharacterized protein n=1 Tax=Hydnum rufescens UP504 TaxID=1448309 RepID=A0A9P6DKQ2_9AGAM|nr:hypothetical protein BS47DRAFT_438025 [Hydnum rufescens UP504]